MTFISRHLVKKIGEEIENKNKILKSNSFLYFDEAVIDKTATINRVDRYCSYPKEEILGLSWYILSPKTLVKIYKNLKENKFYTYKSIEGRSHKIRIKTKK